MNKLHEMIKRRKDQGFTLIELMIVIAVIGILAIVLVPKVGAVKTQAKYQGINTNMRVVEGYVQSKITRWADKGISQADIAEDLDDGLESTSDPISNPFYNSAEGKVISDNIAVAGDGTIHDAIKIVDETTVDDTTEISPNQGTIEVIVPDTGTLAATGIIIKGLDEKGAVYEEVTIKP